MCAGSACRAPSKCAVDAPTVTGSKRAMAPAISVNVLRAGAAALRQVSGLSGQSIQVPACGSNSAGIQKPSAEGDLEWVLDMTGGILTGNRRLCALPLSPIHARIERLQSSIQHLQLRTNGAQSRGVPRRSVHGHALAHARLDAAARGRDGSMAVANGNQRAAWSCLMSSRVSSITCS